MKFATITILIGSLPIIRLADSVIQLLTTISKRCTFLCSQLCLEIKLFKDNYIRNKCLKKSLISKIVHYISNKLLVHF